MILALCGRKTSGKDEFFKYLTGTSEHNFIVKHQNIKTVPIVSQEKDKYVRFAFADFLKDITYEIYPHVKGLSKEMQRGHFQQMAKRLRQKDNLMFCRKLISAHKLAEQDGKTLVITDLRQKIEIDFLTKHFKFVTCRIVSPRTLTNDYIEFELDLYKTDMIVLRD